MAIQIFNAGGLGGGEAVKLLTVGSMSFTVSLAAPCFSVLVVLTVFLTAELEKSVFCVLVPATPSRVKLFDVWKATSAVLVDAPNFPSAVPII